MLLIAEIILGVLFASSITLLLLSIPGSGILSVLSSMFFVSFYMFAGVFLFKAHKANSLAVILSILGISISVIGVLFKILDWPGGMLSLKIGLTSLSIIGLISFFLYPRSKFSVYANLLARSIIYSGVCALMLIANF